MEEEATRIAPLCPLLRGNVEAFLDACHPPPHPLVGNPVCVSRQCILGRGCCRLLQAEPRSNCERAATDAEAVPSGVGADTFEGVGGGRTDGLSPRSYFFRKYTYIDVNKDSPRLPWPRPMQRHAVLPCVVTAFTVKWLDVVDGGCYRREKFFVVQRV